MLVVSQLFEPASGGGTAIDARGAAEAAGRSADVWVLADDRDIDGSRLSVASGTWVDRSQPEHTGRIRVQHRRWRPLRGILDLRRTVVELGPDVIVVFSTWAPGSLACLVLHRIGALGRQRPRLVVAPAGELFEGALNQRRRKKQAMLAVGRAVGLWNGVTWRASDTGEADTIEAEFPGADVGCAPVLPAPVRDVPPRSVDGGEGSVRLISVGTVGVKKGLSYLLDRIAEVARLGVRIELDVFGAEVDQAYSKICRDKIAELPEGAQVNLHGRVDPSGMAGTLARADAFALATQGENFGLAVLEALDAGCPVLVSDRTPWRGLREDGSGWDLPLEEPERWVAALCELASADGSTRSGWSTAASRRAHRARSEALADGIAAWERLLGLGQTPMGA